MLSEHCVVDFQSSTSEYQDGGQTIHSSVHSSSDSQQTCVIYTRPYSLVSLYCEVSQWGVDVCSALTGLLYPSHDATVNGQISEDYALLNW